MDAVLHGRDLPFRGAETIISGPGRARAGQPAAQYPLPIPPCDLLEDRSRENPRAASAAEDAPDRPRRTRLPRASTGSRRSRRRIRRGPAPTTPTQCSTCRTTSSSDPRFPSGATCPGIEVDAEDSPARGDRARLGVGQVPRHVEQLAGSAMRVDDGAGRESEDLVERDRVQMRGVEDDAPASASRASVRPAGVRPFGSLAKQPSPHSLSWLWVSPSTRIPSRAKSVEALDAPGERRRAFHRQQERRRRGSGPQEISSSPAAVVTRPRPPSIPRTDRCAAATIRARSGSRRRPPPSPARRSRPIGAARRPGRGSPPKPGTWRRRAGSRGRPRRTSRRCPRGRRRPESRRELRPDGFPYQPTRAPSPGSGRGARVRPDPGSNPPGASPMKRLTLILLVVAVHVSPRRRLRHRAGVREPADDRLPAHRSKGRRTPRSRCST